MNRDKFERILSIVLSSLLFIGALVPRALDLDTCLTIDEHVWRDLLPTFLRALQNRDWTATFQIAHPGVTVMWILSSGIYGSYLVQKSILRSPIGLNGWQGFLTKVFADPFAVNLLVVERLPFALVSTGIVILAYFFLRKLFGSKAAFLCTALLSYEPLYLAYSRLILPDALITGFMLISILALMVYLKQGGLLYLILSACSAALAFLTKWPALLLAPVEGLMIAATFLSRWHQREMRRLREDILQLGIILFGWGIIVVFVLYAFWPAMWVDVGGTIRRMWAEIKVLSPMAADHTFAGLDFFLGKVIPTLDPGPFFYPVVMMARLTPLTLAGILLLTVPLLFKGRYRLPKALDCKAEIISLAIYLCFFGGLMSLGVIKTDRYILPLFPALNVLAGLGWYSFIASLVNAWNIQSERKPVFWIGAPALIFLLQMSFSLPHFPYFLTYYNPLIGGGQQAVNLLHAGWGEGLDQAAGYLNRKENAANLKVCAFYPEVFGPFFVGQTLEFQRRWQKLTTLWPVCDYAVLYVSSVQRESPYPAMVHYFKSLEPEYTVRLGGIEYAWIYPIPETRIPAELVLTEHVKMTQFGEDILLLGADVDMGQVESDGIVHPTLYWQALREMHEDYEVYLKLVNGVYHVWGGQNGRPVGGLSPTNQWNQWKFVKDEREIPILPGTPPGLYWVEVVLYGSHSGQWAEPLEGQDPRIGPIEIPRRKPPSLDELDINYHTGANLGGQVRLLGYNIESGFRPGDNIHLTLFWQCLEKMEQSYTVFTHLADAGDNLVAQKDNPPVDGFYPTTKWEVGEIVRDQYDLVIPSNVPSGEYRLKVGMYLPETGEHLPIYAASEKYVVADRALSLQQVIIRP